MAFDLTNITKFIKKNKQMKKSNIILLSIGLLVIILFMSYRSTYNTAINLQQNVKKSFANVGTEYQRRADMIPDLVKVVKKAASNEKDILTSVTNARAGISNFSNDINSAKTPQQMDLVGKRINSAINIAVEAYPQITSTEVFMTFQTQLEGTENRIKKARQDYNGVIKEYNSHIRGFFNSMFLNPEIFPKKSPFAAAAGAEVAPTVDFSTKYFFTDIQQRSIRKAIESAELNTSGEIRVHLESKCKIEPKERAIEVFEKLKMNETALRNGVLFYLAVDDKKFAIIGDKGINEQVGDQFWDEVKELMLLEFKREQFSVGLCQGIEMTGFKLKTHFPHQKDDVNELTNDISFEE